MQITDLKKEQQILPLFRLGFRPLFLFGSLFSIVAIVLWALSLKGLVEFNPYGGSYWWHSHEMLFGFASAIIAGFLLTAVQNWTGIPGLRGRNLILLFLLWLVARVGLLFPQFAGSVVIAMLDIAFMPVAAVLLAKPLIAVNQKRNLFFVPVMALFAIANALTHAGVSSGDYSYFQHGIAIAIFLVTLLMVVVGGRVMPMFTANGTQTPKVAPIGWLDKLSIATVVLVLIVHLFTAQQLLPSNVMAGLFFLAGLSNFVRCIRWRIWVTLKVPLVWSLHVSYLCMAIGLMLIGLSYFNNALPYTTALHLLTVGGMGGLILAMISRVSLGHTGRMLELEPMMPIAFICLFLAAGLRVAGVFWLPLQTTSVLSLSALLWVVAYGLFIWYYLPILTQPRQDGRPG